MRNFIIEGRQKSVRLEEFFWRCLDEIAQEKSVKTEAVIQEIWSALPPGQADGSTMSRALRLYILNHYRGA
jgi:predicted DNA-binding ribbon-helix-helix protein